MNKKKEQPIDPAPYQEWAKSALGFEFNDPTLIIEALTHRSYINEHQNIKEHYERLEFLGDSILGVYAHMGAGSITSNVKSDKKLIVIHAKDGDIPTGLKKTGAFLGDHVEVGCNSVLNPGTVIGRGARVYPLSCVRGVVPADSIYKHQGEVALIEKD